MAQKFSDAARAELVAGINSSDVSFTIVTGGNLFPVANTGASAISNSADWFKLVLQDVDGIEIVYVRTHVADSLSFSNILRGQEGTTAKEFLAGSIVGLRPLASDAANVVRLGDARDTAITLALAADPSWLQLADMPAVIAAGADAATARTAIGLGSVDNTSDASKPVSTAQQSALNLKVDTVVGKGLSTEDYSTAEKSKLAGVATGATANATNAELRDRTTHTGEQAVSTITGLQTALDTKANEASTAPLTHVGSGGTEHANASTSVAGFMSATDKTKLDGVAEGATAYTHPANHPASIITQDASNRFVTDAEKSAWDAKGAGDVTLAGVQTLTNKTLTSPTLTTPAIGTPGSGNLSNCTVDGTDAVGFRTIPQVSKSVAYTCVLTDAGKHILHPSADTTARTFTIPANSSVAYPIGTAITFVNQASAGVVTIAITSDTMRLAGAGITGSRALAANGVATAIKLTSTEWIISGSGLT